MLKVSMILTSVMLVAPNIYGGDSSADAVSFVEDVQESQGMP